MHQLKRTFKFYKGFFKPYFKLNGCYGFFGLFFGGFFPFERIGTVLCSWFKEIGTNTLTGWDGTELFIFAVWWIFSLNECFPPRESGTLTVIFPECLVLLGRIVFTLWLYLWLRYVPTFTSTAMSL